MNDNWLDELRESLSDFEMDTPEGLWESLGVEKPVPKLSWRRRWIAAAAVIAILIIGSGIILWLGKTESIGINDIKYAGNNSKEYPGQSESDPDIPEEATTISKGNLRLAESQKTNYIQNSPTVLPDTIRKEDIKPDDKTIQSADEEKPVKEHEPEWQKPFYEGMSPKNRKRDRNDYDRFAINLSASGTGNTSRERNYLMPGMPGNDLFLGSSSITTTEIRHHMPFRIGLTLQYNATERIAFETGLVYSAISSDISLSRNRLTATGTRRLQYVGIPLNVKFSAWSWKFISLYLSAGFTGEKCVSNRFETKSTADGLSLEAYSRQTDRPIQWSVNAAAGIQLRTLPNIGIFAEPGVCYYFNDGTGLSTIYKDHPCNFNLNVGIRFTLNP